MLLETPFNMMIVGMTACGKTYYLLKMLEQDYKKHFDYIFLICPTFEYNKTYENWKYKYDEKFIVLSCDQDQVEYCLKMITQFAKGTNSLIILDDVATSKQVKNRTNELVKLAFSARHYDLSTIVITQQLTSISKPYRENVSKLVTFYNPNAKDTKSIFEEFLAGIEDKNDIIQKLNNNKYAHLEILLRHPYTYEIIIPK